MTESEAQNEFLKLLNGDPSKGNQSSFSRQVGVQLRQRDTVLSVLTRLHDWPDATKALLKKWGYDLPQTAKLVVSTDERIANRWINAYTSSGKNGIYKQWMSASTSAMHILAKDERISTDFPFSIDAINSCTTGVEIMYAGMDTSTACTSTVGAAMELAQKRPKSVTILKDAGQRGR